ncbi:MAG TPA: hypothetical protein VE129_09355 [Thermoanaerobaculia bacterium]|nr:hypothetical protein [Thermoanaerobaculia bacterium]
MRASFVSFLLVAALVLGSGACREAASGGSADRESRRPALTEREAYRPPADAILTVAQIEAFLKVREATVRSYSSPGARAPLEGEEGISRATLARAPEMRAARQLAVPPEEYLWVRERILEAEAAASTAKLNADVLALLDKTLASLRNRRPSAPDDASRKLLDEQIASFEAEAVRVRREAGEKEPDAIRANLKVLGPYRQRISAIADELAELSAADAAALPTPPK